MAVHRRLERQARREQIINATLDLVAEHGVTGTTLSRIAEAVDVTTPALYAHFANRQEILLATLGLIFEKVHAIHHLATEGSALDRLREIAHRHTELVASRGTGFLPALFEFIAAPPAEGLRDALGKNHLGLVEELSEIVREGQREGTIVERADPEQIAWLMVSRAWTEDVSQLMGTTEGWNESRSNRMLELILSSIAVPDGIERTSTEDRAVEDSGARSFA